MINIKRYLSYLAAFFLGVAAVFAWQHLPVLRTRLNGSHELGVVVPALAETTYTFQRSRGFDALLTTAEGQRLEFPRAWLPGDARPGARYRVTTEIRPSKEASRFAATLVPEDGP